MSFNFSDPVIKATGDYGGPGRVVASFEATPGNRRYVVAFKIEGGFGEFFHILTEKQLQPNHPGIGIGAAASAELQQRLKRLNEGKSDRIITPEPEVTQADIAQLDVRMKQAVRLMGGLASQISRLDERTADDVKATDTRLDRLSGIIDELDKRLKAVEPEKRAVTGAGADKRWFGGGWINVYRDGGAFYHRTRADAESAAKYSDAAVRAPQRVACVQLRYVYEGEGL